jgi:type I restriction enzyme R subunit
MPREEREKYQNMFAFYSKVRRTVKIRYCDAIDNSEYEPLMQNLLDTHMSVAGLKQITAPVDILNQTDLEKELDELGSLRSKADAIQSKLAKSISIKRDENPAYYDSFSKRIKDTLQEYKDRIITDAEYLAKIRSIMKDYVEGVSTVKFPEKLNGNNHAQAFYGVVSAILDDELDKSSDLMHAAEEPELYGGKPINIGEPMSLQEDIPYGETVVQSNQELIADISIEITKIVEKHSQVDWTNNKSIHDKIAQDIDDMFYDYECKGKCKFSFDVIDKVIENVKTTALRRFKR